MRCYGVTGWKSNGKTGLIERLVAHFCMQGLSVSTIKHAHHSFDVDQAGRDSYRHREAGAHEVLLASQQRIALMQELRGAPEPPLAALIARLTPVDLLLIEGYKNETHPKIEVHRSEAQTQLLAHTNSSIHAVASDVPLTLDRPVFDLDATDEIADFIAKELNI